jgi:hypothetical protein
VSAPGAPEPVVDGSTARPLLLAALALRGAGLVALVAVAWLVWRRGIRNVDQLTARPGDLLFFFVHGVHLVFHEAGHWIFAPFGELMGVLGGSLNQVLVPALCAATFYGQGRYASGAFTLFWVGQAMADVAVYAADARERLLPLLGDGDPAVHDWGRLLGWWGLLDRAEAVGRLIFGLGLCVIVGSLLLLGLEILRLWQTPHLATAPAADA